MQMRSRTFEALKPLTLQIVPNRSDPKQLSSVLASIQDLIASQPSDGVRLSMDYILYPLMIIIESGCQARTGGVPEKGRVPAHAAFSASSSDKVFESALTCVVTAIDRAGIKCFHDSALMLGFLERWVPMLMMDRDKVTEEALEMGARIIRLVFHSAGTST